MGVLNPGLHRACRDCRSLRIRGLGPRLRTMYRRPQLRRSQTRRMKWSEVDCGVSLVGEVCAGCRSVGTMLPLWRRVCRSFRSR